MQMSFLTFDLSKMSIFNLWIVQLESCIPETKNDL